MKEKASLKTLEEKQSGRGQARINRRVSGESFLSSYFLYCTLESISCKFHEYVGNPRPSVIRCLFLYNNPCYYPIGPHGPNQRPHHFQNSYHSCGLIPPSSCCHDPSYSWYVHNKVLTHPFPSIYHIVGRSDETIME